MDSQCCIKSGLVTVYHLFGLPYLLKEPWEFALLLYMCFEDLQRNKGSQFDLGVSRLRLCLFRWCGFIDSQHTLVRFKAEYEVSELKISTSKSEAVVICWKKMGSTLCIGRWSRRWTADLELLVAMQALYWTTVVKKSTFWPLPMVMSPG